MKLRTANKIMNAVNTSRETAYSEQQLQAANIRYKSTKDFKESEKFWRQLMKWRAMKGLRKK